MVGLPKRFVLLRAKKKKKKKKMPLGLRRRLHRDLWRDFHSIFRVYLTSAAMEFAPKEIRRSKRYPKKLPLKFLKALIYEKKN